MFLKTNVTISRLAIIPVVVGLIALFLAPSASAVPSFARQTGASCAMCHTTAFGPNLTPYGREFKLNGYVWDKGESDTYVPPISGMVLGSFTNTRKNQDPPPGPYDAQGRNINGFNANNNFAFDQASLFYAGKIWDKLGAFSQLTFDGVNDVLFMDNTDVRFAGQADLFGHDLVYGISANNNPTVQDLWNTTPVWGFPYATSPVAPTPDAAGMLTMLDGGLDGVAGGQVGGATLYAMIERFVYLEAGAYTSFSRNFMAGTGNYAWPEDGLSPLNRISGGAPYWRLAFQKSLNGHYFQLGHYGMTANVQPYRLSGVGTDSYTDLAMDATYQYLGNMDHIFEVKTTYIRENRDLGASFGLAAAGIGDPTNINRLNSFKINAAYTFLQTYSLNFGYNQTSAYATEPSGLSVNGNFGNQYFITELDYIPFGKDSSMLGTLLNLRIGLQYIGYNQFNGLHAHAGDNNTFLLNGWLAF